MCHATILKYLGSEILLYLHFCKYVLISIHSFGLKCNFVYLDVLIYLLGCCLCGVCNVFVKKKIYHVLGTGKSAVKIAISV